MENNNEEFKKLMEENLELSKDSNKMLHKLRGAQKKEQLFRGIYWLIIIAIAVGGFVYIKPWLAKIETMYSEFGKSFSDIKNIGNSFPSADKFKDFFNPNPPTNP